MEWLESGEILAGRFLGLVRGRAAGQLRRRMNFASLASFARGFGFAALSAVAVSTAFAQEVAEEAEPKTFAEAINRAGIKTVAGPVAYKLGKVAELKLPAGYTAIESGSIKGYYELTQNIYSDNKVGVVIGPPPSEWVLVFAYDETGYVKDDDKNALDADKLMKSLTKGQEEANKVRAKQGWDEMKFAGWANQPRYDEKTNNLTWAVKLTSSQDGHKEAFLNESIRLLGRGGVMNVTLVTDPTAYNEDSATVAGLLSRNFEYVAGQRYAEFREGDKIAEYGLAALVLGGAGAAAFKLGFVQKFWKVLVVGVVAIGAFVKKMWSRLMGREEA